MKPTPRERAVNLARQVWFLPTVLTLATGSAAISRPELWRDELRSWSAASRSFVDLFHLLAKTDAGVALYYILLKCWIGVFGDSVASMRMLSALAMAGAAAVVALIGQRLWNFRTGLLAGVIFAVIPAVSRFAEEVRPYALTMLLAALGTLLLLRALEKPTWGRFAAYGASLTGLALMQVVAIPLLVAHLVGVLLWWQRSRVVAVRWVVSVGVGLLLAAPVVLLSHAQYPHQVGDLPDASIHELTRLPGRLFASWLVAGAVIGVGLLAWNLRFKPAIFAAAWATLPIAAIWLVSNLGESYWMARYMVFTLPGFALLAAAALSMMRVRMAVIMVVILAVVGAADQKQLRQVGSHDQWTYPEPPFVHYPILYSAAADTIRAEMQPGDGIAYAARGSFWLFDIGMAYHLRDTTMPRDVFVQTNSIDNADFWPVECGDYAACLPKDVPRLWLLNLSAGPDIDFFNQLEDDKAKVIFGHFGQVKTWHSSGITVTLMERLPGK